MLRNKTSSPEDFDFTRFVCTNNFAKPRWESSPHVPCFQKLSGTLEIKPLRHAYPCISLQV